MLSNTAASLDNDMERADPIKVIEDEIPNVQSYNLQTVNCSSDEEIASVQETTDPHWTWTPPSEEDIRHYIENHVTVTQNIRSNLANVSQEQNKLVDIDSKKPLDKNARKLR